MTFSQLYVTAYSHDILENVIWGSNLSIEMTQMEINSPQSSISITLEPRGILK